MGDLLLTKDAKLKSPRLFPRESININLMVPLNYRINKEEAAEVKRPIQRFWPGIRSVSQISKRKRRISTSKRLVANLTRSTLLRKTIPFSVPPTVIFFKVVANFDNFLPRYWHIVNITDVN